jgi:multicomponent Na+:H+ antiporter subunit D
VNELAPVAVVFPLAAAALLAAAGRVLPRAARDAIALASCIASTALCAALLLASRAGLAVSWLGGWRPRGDVAVGIAFAVDPLGAGFAALSGALATAALVFALRWFESAEGHFHALVLLFLAGLVGFGLTGDLFDLFVFFELMSVAGYALAGYRSEEPDVLQGALHFAVVNTAGAALVLLGIALLYGATGALSLAQLAEAVPAAPRPAALAAFALLTCGFLVKAAAVPFHFWLADAHAVAPTPACVLFSGVMVEAGLYAVARLDATAFGALVPAGGAGPGLALVMTGALSAAVGAALAFAQRHLKRLLAFSTISHAGAMLVAVGLATPAGVGAAAAYALGHGLVKGSLFLGAGLVLHRLRSVDEVALRGRGRHRDLAAPAALLGVGGLALAGLPPFGTWRGEALLHAALEEAGLAPLGLLLDAASIVTGAAVLRATLRIFVGLGPREPEAPGVGGEVTERPETPRSPTTPRSMVGAAAALLLLGLAAGAWPALGEGARAAAARFVDGRAYAARVLRGVPEVAVREEAPPAWEGAGRGGAAAVAAAALALAVLGRRRAPERLRAALRRAWVPPITALRALHGGRIGDSVTWLALGAAIFGGLAFALG